MTNSKSAPEGFDSAGRRASTTGQAIRVPKTAEIVSDLFRKRIIRGELQEGDFLPPEGQLLATLGISRPTLREAFRILEAESLITVTRGSRSGARVNRPRTELASHYVGLVLQAGGTTVADVYEARLALEPFIARRLAERRSPEAVERLRTEITRLEFLVDDERYIDFMIALAEFHVVLAEVGGNATLLLITRMLQDVLSRYQVNFFQIYRLGQEVQRQRGLAGVKSFRKLVDLIEAGDAAKAEAHWRLHLINANASWVQHDNTKVIDVLD